MNKSYPHVICDDCIILDYILLFSNYIPTILHYILCIIRGFTKYRLFSRLNKCDFFQSWVEYTDYNFATRSNCPTVWKLAAPTSRDFASIFIGVWCFYNRYFYWFETNINLLGKLQQFYHHNAIPIIGWIPTFI